MAIPTLTIGVIGAAVGAIAGGTLGTIGAIKEHQQQLDAAEQDRKDLVIRRGGEDADREALQSQTEAYAADLLGTMDANGNWSGGALGTRKQEALSDLTATAEADRGVLAANENAELLQIGRQSATAQIGASEERAQLLVAQEQAMGEAGARASASGVRGGVGSALENTRQIASTTNTNLQTSSRNLRNTQTLLDAAASGVDTRYDNQRTALNARVTRESNAITYDFERQISNATRFVENRLEDIERQQTLADQAYTSQLNWMDKQIEEGGKVGSWALDIANGTLRGATGMGSAGGNFATFFE